MKLNINRISIWTESGQACCAPGSIGEIFPVLRESIKSAEAWIEAAEAVVRQQ
jgi:hypothetical protein